MSKQFEQFELLYKQVLATSKEIKTLIDEQNYDEILSREGHKGQLVSKISLVEKTLDLSEEQKVSIEDLRAQILAQDKENIERMQTLRDETFMELKKENEKEKFANKYEQKDYETGTICDYTSD